MFSTNAGVQNFTFDILGINVRVKATPLEYTWHFDDGSTLTTTTAGKPYPSKEITHKYRASGARLPYVTVTYKGQFAVPGGTFVDIPGTVAIPGPKTKLQVKEARSELVSGYGTS